MSATPDGFVDIPLGLAHFHRLRAVIHRTLPSGLWLGVRVTGRQHDREILRLAIPAFLALVAEPLFLLSDAAIVGHLGTPELAGLGVAAALLATAVNVFVFLAYATTAAVARRVGAGDMASTRGGFRRRGGRE